MNMVQPKKRLYRNDVSPETREKLSVAHLPEMNHSQRFHLLCNKYCNGLEKQYINELKHYHWPVLK